MLARIRAVVRRVSENTVFLLCVLSGHVRERRMKALYDHFPDLLGLVQKP